MALLTFWESLSLMRQLDSPICVQLSPWLHLGKEGLVGPWGPGYPPPPFRNYMTTVCHCPFRNAVTPK